MKIGLNGQKLLIENPAGPEIYTLNIFKSFAKIDKENEYIVYFSSNPSEKYWVELAQNNPNFSYKVLPLKISWTQISLAQELFKNKVDILFSAVHTIPVIHPGNLKIVSMIHGLEYKINQQFEKNSFKKMIHPILLWWVLVFSNVIVVPSNTTKNAIIGKRWKFINLSKLNIISEGVSSDFYKRSGHEVESIKEKYGIKGKEYLIFVSTIQPRKNIPKMIQALSDAFIKYQDLKKYMLLISGKLGWQYQDSLDAPKKYSIDENVKFLGRTPDEDLPPLLSGAKYFISCSFDEGFGIPLLEAMACETPVIVSNIPAYKELAKDIPIYVNPIDIADISKKISDALHADVPLENIKKGKELSKEFTWEKSAEQLISLFNRCLENR